MTEGQRALVLRLAAIGVGLMFMGVMLCIVAIALTLVPL